MKEKAILAGRQVQQKIFCSSRNLWSGYPMPMPNFLVVGTAKAGTTALFYHLKQHPQIYLSPVKEPRFFAFEGETLNFNGPRDERLKLEIVTRIEDYRALFGGVAKEAAIGEISPVYLYLPKASERIRHYIPEAKLIVILRDPIERAYSSFLAERQAGREPLASFAQALHEEPTRIRRRWSYVWHYKERGFYHAQLKRYFEKFDREQIRVYLYEDWEADNVRILRDIFRFLNVDEAFVPNTSIKYNTSRIPKMRALHRCLTKQGPIQSALKPFLPKKLRRWAIVKLTNLNMVKPPLPSTLREYLVQIYRADILRLQDFIERDLSEWLECRRSV